MDDKDDGADDSLDVNGTQNDMSTVVVRDQDTGRGHREKTRPTAVNIRFYSTGLLLRIRLGSKARLRFAGEQESREPINCRLCSKHSFSQVRNPA